MFWISQNSIPLENELDVGKMNVFVYENNFWKLLCKSDSINLK